MQRIEIVPARCLQPAALTCAVAARGATLPAAFVEFHERPDPRRRRWPSRRTAACSSPSREVGGIAFDPDFATNQYVYVYYTDRDPPAQPRQPLHRQRRRRRPGSEQSSRSSSTSTTSRHQPQRRRDPLRPRRQALRRRRRQRERQPTPRRSQPARQDACASTPTARSRPTTRSTTRPAGANRAIWALGLRNPFTFAFQPGTGRMFINDVGQSTWEEINDGIAGANYGWPTTEGTDHQPATSAARSTPTPRTGRRPAAPSPAARSTTRPRQQLPGRLRRRLLLRRLIFWGE